MKMFNINKIVVKEYEAAGELRNQNFIQAYGRFFYLILVSIALLTFEGLSYIFYLIFPPKREKINNQLALVTGGGNGLGRAICFRLAHEGCDIAVVDLDYENARKTASELEENLGVKSRAFQCDISDYSSVLDLKVKVEKEMRVVDILVNNAGLLYMSDFLKSEMKDIQRVVDVNLTSQFMAVHTFLPAMIEQRRGKIVSICSVTALNPMPTAVVYTATKYAINGFMDCLNDELSMTDKDEFIKLTTVFPDFMNTRKELSDVLESINYKFPRLLPERVADEAVVGMLTDCRKVFVSDMKLAYYALMSYPYRMRKSMLKMITDVKLLLK